LKTVSGRRRRRRGCTYVAPWARTTSARPTHRAKHALAELDQILDEARALANRPGPARRDSLNDAEIKRMAEHVYVKELAWDERTRYGRDELKRIEAEHVRLEGPLSGAWAFPYDTLPAHGLSPAQLAVSSLRETSWTCASVFPWVTSPQWKSTSEITLTVHKLLPGV
jgi:hypothetical protein